MVEHADAERLTFCDEPPRSDPPAPPPPEVVAALHDRAMHRLDELRARFAEAVPTFPAASARAGAVPLSAAPARPLSPNDPDVLHDEEAPDAHPPT